MGGMHLNKPVHFSLLKVLREQELFNFIGKFLSCEIKTLCGDPTAAELGISIEKRGPY